MKRLRRMFGGLAVLILVLVLSPGATEAVVQNKIQAVAGPNTQAAGDPGVQTTVRANGTYSNWNWPSSVSLYSFDQRLTILNYTSGANYYWAHQIRFINGDGGYLGLQVGSYPDDTKIALFSLWGANGAYGSKCGTFVEGGSGYTCRIDPFNWEKGRTYRLRISELHQDAGGRWWGAWVQDTVTGTDHPIGALRVPLTWGRLGTWSVSWTEHFGPLASICDELPWGYAHFGHPTANNGSVNVASHTHFINEQNACRPYSRIIEYGGDLQEQGKLR